MIKPWVFEFFPARSFSSAEDLDYEPDAVQQRFQDFIELWRRDEQLGYEGVFFSEHHFGQAYSPSPNLVIAHLAALTTTLRLGLLGTVSPYATPWRVIEELGMLDQLAGGRLELGVVPGIAPEFRKISISVEEAVERHAEIMDVLEAALRDRVISHHGKHWQLENVTFKPVLYQRDPRIWTSAVSLASIERAGARGWKVCSGFLPVPVMRERFDAYRAAAAAAGHDRGPDDLAMRRAIAFNEPGETRLQAKERVKQEFMRSFFDLPEGQAPTLSDDEVIAGSPEEVAEEIVRQCREVGCANFLMSVPTPDVEVHVRAHEIFATEVNPVLRAAEV